MQVIVTSYCRFEYLKRTLESLRQDDIDLIVVDGGSDRDTVRYIEQMADSYILLEGNPGADVLKNRGIELITDNEFMITSDDLVYPKGYSKLLMAQYYMINPDYPKIEWTFMACSMSYVEKVLSERWIVLNGVWICPVHVSQVAGAILNRWACETVGGFPVYDRAGTGDFAISKRLRELGLKIGYFRQPVIDHIGANKHEDYPEYSKIMDIELSRGKLNAMSDNKKYMDTGA